MITSADMHQHTFIEDSRSYCRIHLDTILCLLFSTVAVNEFYEQKKSYLSLTNVTIKLTEREVLVYFFSTVTEHTRMQLHLRWLVCFSSLLGRFWLRVVNVSLYFHNPGSPTNRNLDTIKKITPMVRTILSVLDLWVSSSRLRLRRLELLLS